MYIYCVLQFIYKLYYFPIDKQLNMLETLLNHFVDLVQQRSLLLQRIKKSKDGSHLKIEAAFQKYVGEIPVNCYQHIPNTQWKMYFNFQCH